MQPMLAAFRALTKSKGFVNALKINKKAKRNSR